MAVRSIAGRFRIRTRLGGAAWGTRFAALGPDGNACELTVLRPEICGQDDAGQRLREVANRLQDLPEQRFVRLLDADGVGDGTLFVAAEAGGGKTLAEVVAERGPLDPKQVLSIGWRLREALGILHRRGTTHGGLTLHSVIVDEVDGQSRYRLRDCGLAQMLDGLPPSDRADRELAALQAVMRIGAADHTLRAGDTPDDDLVALGCALYEAATGQAALGSGGDDAGSKAWAAAQRLTELDRDLAMQVQALLKPLEPETDPADATVPGDLPDFTKRVQGEGMRDTMGGIGAESDDNALPVVPPARNKALRVTPGVPPKPVAVSSRHISGGFEARPISDRHEAAPEVADDLPPMPPPKRRISGRYRRPTLPPRRKSGQVAAAPAPEEPVKTDPLAPLPTMRPTGEGRVSRQRSSGAHRPVSDGLPRRAPDASDRRQRVPTRPGTGDDAPMDPLAIAEADTDPSARPGAVATGSRRSTKPTETEHGGAGGLADAAAAIAGVGVAAAIAEAVTEPATLDETARATTAASPQESNEPAPTAADAAGSAEDITAEDVAAEGITAEDIAAEDLGATLDPGDEEREADLADTLPDRDVGDRDEPIARPRLRATRQGIGIEPARGLDEAGAASVPAEKRSDLRQTLPSRAPTKSTMLPWGPGEDGDDIAQPMKLPAHLQQLVDTATANEPEAPPSTGKPATMLPGALPSDLRAELQAGLDAAEQEKQDARRLPSGMSVSKSGTFLPWKAAADATPQTPYEEAIESIEAHEITSIDEPEQTDDAGATEDQDSIDDILAVDNFFDPEKAAAPPTQSAEGINEPSVVETDRQRAAGWLPWAALVLVGAGAAFWFQYRQLADGPHTAPPPAAAASAAPEASGTSAANAPGEQATAGGARTAGSAAPAAVANAAPANTNTARDPAPPPRPGEAGAARPAVGEHGPTGSDPVASPTHEEGGPGDGEDETMGVAPTAAEPEYVDVALPEGFVRVDKGGYPIGCAPSVDGCEEDAMPEQDVTVLSYGFMQREVTVAEYRKCVAAGACPVSHHDEACNSMHLGRGNHPITCVDWGAADSFCRWKGWRLPTEAEWEIAARGRRRVRYPWGGQWPSCERAVIAGVAADGCGKGHTAEVATTTGDRSWCGALDLGGNVAEWVADDYAPYPSSLASSQVAQESLGHKVYRGGTYTSAARAIPYVHVRMHAERSLQRRDLGFRCAISLQVRAAKATGQDKPEGG